MTNQNLVATPSLVMPGQAPPRTLGAGWPIGLFAVALVLGVVARIIYGWGASFWFDETFSGVIATQTSFRALLSWCLSEVTGPAYYMPLWAWEKVAGPSDAALRAPSLFFSIAAPLFMAWKGHPDRTVRLFWATLVLLWIPAMVFAFEARPYPQLFFLCAVQIVAFARLLQDPTRGRAFAWSAVTALAVLTNYQALVIGGVQGIIYLAHHRKTALSTWPALAPFVVMGAWLVAHISFLLPVMGALGAFHGVWPLSHLTELPAILFGSPLHGAIVLGTIAISLTLALRRAQTKLTIRFTPAGLSALSAIIAFAIVFGLAFLRPGFAPRYLTPVMPGVLFAIALWAEAQLRRDAKYVAIVFAMMLIMTAGVAYSSLTEPSSDSRHMFNLEQPSAWLSARAPKRLVYFWDGPVGEASSKTRIAEVAGFFFRRAGQPLSVTIVHAPHGTDPNRAVLAEMAGDPQAGVLWMSNDGPPAERLPRLSRIEPRLECRDFGNDEVVVTACRQR